jgi:hypothetical protein
MTPSKRTAEWRKENPIRNDWPAQEAMLKAWAADRSLAPWALDPHTFEIISKRSYQAQKQFIYQSVRFNRSSLTWFLLENEILHPAQLVFNIRERKIGVQLD